jgi:hypothetical protein
MLLCLETRPGTVAEAVGFDSFRWTFDAVATGIFCPPFRSFGAVDSIMGKREGGSFSEDTGD